MRLTLASRGRGGRPGPSSLDGEAFLHTYPGYLACRRRRGWKNASTPLPHCFHNVCSGWRTEAWYSASPAHRQVAFFAFFKSTVRQVLIFLNGSRTPIFRWRRAGARPPPPHHCPGLRPATMADGDEEILHTGIRGRLCSPYRQRRSDQALD
jgi:hypothetical protein